MSKNKKNALRLIQKKLHRWKKFFRQGTLVSYTANLYRRREEAIQQSLASNTHWYMPPREAVIDVYEIIGEHDGIPNYRRLDISEVPFDMIFLVTEDLGPAAGKSYLGEGIHRNMWEFRALSDEKKYLVCVPYKGNGAGKSYLRTPENFFTVLSKSSLKKPLV